MNFNTLEKKIQSEILKCTRCPRLRAHCEKTAVQKKRAYQNDTYWGKPVAGFGDRKAQIWIIGLAPAAHGANRTGRMFTGDRSGQWLYRALFKAGLANQPTYENRGDGLRLKNTYISAVIRCAPPQNKPLPKEISNCKAFLEAELTLLCNAQVIVCLGKIAFDQTLKLLNAPSPKPQFKHGNHYKIADFWVLCSYHPSQQNTFTGVLTETMFDQVFKLAKSLPL